MITSRQCFEHYGTPSNGAPWMALWDVPKDLEIGVIPKRIYCNKDLILPLQSALINLISRGYAEGELLTWDGCFNIREMKGGLSMSLHSWGLAVDVNAFSNGFGKKPTLSKGFVECFDGFDWGGLWTRPDGMHFQLAKI
jgi:hypothetical protein